MVEFRLPRPPSTGKGWIAASIAAHLVLGAGLVWASTQEREEYGEPRLIRIVLEPEASREVTMRYADPVAGGVTAGRPEAVASVGRVVLAPAESGRSGVGVRQGVAVPESLAIGVPGASSTVAGAIVVGTERPIGPAFGDGRVWDIPAWVEDDVVGADGATWSPGESALALRVAEMLDSLAADSSLRGGEIPDWVFDVGGQQWGVDPRFIHLGPIKIPTFLLGLLPIPSTTNFDQVRQDRWLADVRDQIRRQAANMENMADFRRYVAELRERRDRERQAERRAIATRDTIVP